MENKPERDNENIEKETIESNAAKVLKARYKEEEKSEEQIRKGNFWENFWYHHKWKVVMIGVFGFMGITLLVQFLQQSNPDIHILYAGPDYITANQNQKFCRILGDMMEDYNGDGEKKAILSDIIFLSAAQAEAAEAEALQRGEEYAVNWQTNNQTSEQFTYEIMAGDSLLCLLSEDQYKMVLTGDGFVPLSEVFDEIPETAMDEYGIRFSETEFCRFYSDAQIFPEDTVLALRRVTSINQIRSPKKMEALHGFHRDLFEKIVQFTFPDGYTETPQQGD